MWMTWREAMRTGLYGPAGFYARGEPPSRHFRTSAHVSSAYAGAMLSLLREADATLGRPARLDRHIDAAARYPGLLLRKHAARPKHGRLLRTDPLGAGHLQCAAGHHRDRDRIAGSGAANVLTGGPGQGGVDFVPRVRARLRPVLRCGGTSRATESCSRSGIHVWPSNTR